MEGGFQARICMCSLTKEYVFDVIQRLAKYTFDVFNVYSTHGIFKPAEYRYNLLE